MAHRKQAKFALKVKTRLLGAGKTIKQLGAELNPPRPRSTTSTAIHTDRYPRVREQIKEALSL